MATVYEDLLCDYCSVSYLLNGKMEWGGVDSERYQGVQAEEWP